MNYITKRAKMRDSGEEFARKHPHHHLLSWNRPDVTRRAFFQLGAAGLTGSFLMPHLRAASSGVVNSGKVTHNTAKKVIFIHLLGAMSHVDTLDFKTAPENTFLNPTSINGLTWPVGLLPKLGARLNDVAILRSVQSWALVHSLAQTWAQIGRNPAAALGDIAPNVGSIVALEKDPEKLATQVFPSFIALNAGGASGQGYLKSSYAPFKLTPRVNANSISGTSNSQGQAVFNTWFSRLQQYDGAMRDQAPYGHDLADMDAMYEQARGLMYSDPVNAAFSVSTQDSLRYGTGTAATNFGNACALARQVLAADQGTRFVQINIGGWDHHADIYAQNNLLNSATQLDNGLGALLDDLKSTGRLNETLIIVMGEFGRTPGISTANGRDHYLVHSVLMAGGGVKGGKVIGATNAAPTANPGGTITDFGWAGSDGVARMIRPEDIECTMYSALGIDWTTIRYDDPFGRGYEYIPFAKDGKYGPINELFT
jgi:hypothetical protein